jgi:hypothetical protein
LMALNALLYSHREHRGHRELDLMGIEEIVTEWFGETAAEMNKRSKGEDAAKNLCSSVLPVVHNYSSATFVLLRDNRKLPAMALIRVLAELTFRLIWCLSSGKNKEEIGVRIKRWWKESYIQEKRVLEKCINSLDKSRSVQMEKRIKWLDSEILKISYKSAGDLYGSLNDLTVDESIGFRKVPSWKNDLYPKLYSVFNQAIHPDLTLLSKLTKRRGDILEFHEDYDSVDTEVLKIYCMSCVFNAIAVTRIVYGLSYNEIKTQYLESKRK